MPAAGLMERRMKLKTKFSTFLDRVIEGFGMLGVLVLLFLLVLTNKEIVGRYFLNRPTAWSLEIIEYGLLYLTFLGAAWLLKNEEHIVMDIVYDQLRPGVQVWVNIITSAMAAIGCFIVTWYGVKACWGFYQTGQYFAAYLEPPKWIIVGIVPLGTLLLCVQFIRRTYGYFKRRKGFLEEKKRALGELEF
jgi:TRAP-type C4-dicarboxylate transport system permease small subunit